jgi:hypothetical protein
MKVWRSASGVWHRVRLTSIGESVTLCGREVGAVTYDLPDNEKLVGKECKTCRSLAVRTYVIGK